MRRAAAVFWMLAGAWVSNLGAAGGTESGDPYSLVASMLSDERAVRAEASAALEERADLSAVPALVDAVFFTPRSSRRVFAVRLAQGVKAYPVDRVLDAGVVNDRIGTEPVLIVGDRSSGSVRAYRRGPHEFALEDGGWLQDNLGGRWSVEEQGLRKLDAAEEPSVLERLSGSCGPVVRLVWVLSPDRGLAGIGRISNGVH